MVCRNAKQRSIVDVRESPSTEFEGIQRREPRGPSGWFLQGSIHRKWTFWTLPTSYLCSSAGSRDQCALTNAGSVCFLIGLAGSPMEPPIPSTLIPQLKSLRTSHCHQIEHLQNESGVLRCKCEQTACNYQTQNANMMIRGHLRK